MRKARCGVRQDTRAVSGNNAAAPPASTSATAAARTRRPRWGVFTTRRGEVERLHLRGNPGDEQRAPTRAHAGGDPGRGSDNSTAEMSPLRNPGISRSTSNAAVRVRQPPLPRQVEKFP